MHRASAKSTSVVSFDGSPSSFRVEILASVSMAPAVHPIARRYWMTASLVQRLTLRLSQPAMPPPAAALPSMRTGARGHCRVVRCAAIASVYRAVASQTALRGGLEPAAGQMKRAGGDTSMTNKAERRPRSSAISRRRVVTSLTVGVGAAALISRAGLAQRVQVAPPSTITTPPRDFGPQRRADHIFHRSRRALRRSAVRPVCPTQQCHPAPVDRRAVGGGAGLERRGPLSRLERHPQ